MITVRDLLRTKGNQVWYITPDTAVIDALKEMADKDVGALLVLENDRIEGIISERDFVRSIVDTGECMIHMTIREHMTKDVYTITPSYTIEECMSLMTEKRIRHLPVLENNELVGMISIGDVVKEMISLKETTINHLENYIEGRGYGQ
jgi:CBS domain-containing protein